ncbi:MAG TPA: VWA domain-containing protein [Candidatus Acidoferrales bacterium]
MDRMRSFAPAFLRAAKPNGGGMTILRRLAATALAFFLAAPAPVTPQQPPPSQRPPDPAQQRAQDDDPRFRIRRSVELVVVPVTVKDSRGRLVYDIRQDEFRIFEDGVEQEIALYSVDPFPLSAHVLIDSGLPQSTSEMVAQASPAIAGGFSQFDEVSVSLFELFTRPLLEFTADNDKLFDMLKRLELGGYTPGQGSTAMTNPPRVNTGPPLDPRASTRQMPTSERNAKNLDDAIHEAAQSLRDRGRERRKIIFIISDGRNSRSNTFSFDDTLKLLLSSDISVYAIGVGDAGILNPNNTLARYARQTGGDIFYARGRGDLESAFSRVTEQSRNQYTLAYTPRDTSRTSDYRSIEVRVRRPSLTLLTRDGYFAIPLP